MNTDSFLINEFRGVMRVHDAEGRYLDMKCRHCAVLIVTVRGYIRFTQNGKVFISDPTHPVFIPEGASYINECIEEADSLMFSFRTAESYGSICPLTPLPLSECIWYYEMIERAEITKKSGYRQKQLSLLYEMLSKLFAASEKKESIAERCAAVIRERYHDRAFTCAVLSREMFISEAYLRREFKKEYRISLGEYLRCVRLERARELLLEKRSVGETALSCGYSDVYQFSRAYKKHFGYAPRETCKGETAQ